MNNSRKQILLFPKKSSRDFSTRAMGLARIIDRLKEGEHILTIIKEPEIWKVTISTHETIRVIEMIHISPDPLQEEA